MSIPLLFNRAICPVDLPWTIACTLAFRPDTIHAPAHLALLLLSCDARLVLAPVGLPPLLAYYWALVIDYHAPNEEGAVALHRKGSWTHGWVLCDVYKGAW